MKLNDGSFPRTSMSNAADATAPSMGRRVSTGGRVDAEHSPRHFMSPRGGDSGFSSSPLASSSPARRTAVHTVSKKSLSTATRRRRRLHARQRVSRCVRGIGVGGLVLLGLAALYGITHLRMRVLPTRAVDLSSDGVGTAPPPLDVAGKDGAAGVDPFGIGAVAFHDVAPVEVVDRYSDDDDEINSQGHSGELEQEDWEEELED